MMKLKAFTFIELLLVMTVLGVIMTLTLPVIKNIKDDDDIHRAYMKKANQDVTDASSMIFIKNPSISGMKQMSRKFSEDDNGLRDIYNTALNSFECGECTDSAETSTTCVKGPNNGQYPCTTTDFCTESGSCAGVGGSATKEGGSWSVDSMGNPGLVIGGKAVWIFDWLGGGSVDDGTGEKIYGYIYVDMNRDKKPNAICKDRYVFAVYDDRVAMVGCDFGL